MNSIAECTIFMDRYQGSYSGGEWIAVPFDPDTAMKYIGANPNSDDVAAQNILWKNLCHGVGNTPDEAYKALLESYSTWRW